jgi:hypothetical protein
MKYFDICTRKTYKKDGEDKVSWLKCGTMRVNDEGKQFIQMNHQPDITFFVFEPKKKEPSESSPATPSDIQWQE